VKIRPEAPIAAPPPQVVSAPVAATQPSQVDDGGSSPVSTLKWVVGGVAVAGLATGGILLAVQKGKASEYERNCSTTAQADTPYCNNLRSDVTVGGPLWTAPIVAFSVGGGLAAIATVLFIVDATDDDSSGSARACGAGPGEIGVACQLRF
ncbi:MAG TPA: hypothetical protein VJR89_17635, partial [Polyangiales bacterium]|nr:hypothetical protein [Polyangiales bacterium]